MNDSQTVIRVGVCLYFPVLRFFSKKKPFSLIVHRNINFSKVQNNPQIINNLFWRHRILLFIIRVHISTTNHFVQTYAWVWCDITTCLSHHQPPTFFHIIPKQRVPTIVWVCTRKIVCIVFIDCMMRIIYHKNHTKTQSIFWRRQSLIY